ncbi:MAG: carboxypeptidase regulatory-like domain-containing protein, partial [candidate division WOR-3 bacterium]
MRKLLLLLLLVYTIPCLAQDAKLKGTVYSLDTDGTRKVLPAASVRLEGTAVQQEVLADAEGRFLFTDIPPGDYTLHVSMQGFDPYTKSYKLLPGSVGNLEIDLKISPVSEVMEVRTQAIDRSNTSTSSSITERVLRSAPMVNEQFQEALPMLPGIVRGPDGMLNIKGARSGQTGLLVNSTNVTDPVTGDYAISLPLEAVQSVTVLSNPYSAEYGKFSGAVTSVSTRSGGDKWRLLFTNFIPRLRRREDSQGKTHIVGLSSLTPRLVVTGPLIQNRLTISQSFEYKFVRTRIPSLPDLRNDTVLETFDSFTQLDYKLNNHNTLQAIASIFPQNSSFVNLNTFNEMEVTPNFRQRGFFISLSARSIVGHGGLFESNFSVKRFNAFVFPALVRPSGPQGKVKSWVLVSCSPSTPAGTVGYFKVTGVRGAEKHRVWLRVTALDSRPALENSPGDTLMGQGYRKPLLQAYTGAPLTWQLAATNQGGGTDTFPLSCRADFPCAVRFIDGAGKEINKVTLGGVSHNYLYSAPAYIKAEVVPTAPLRKNQPGNVVFELGPGRYSSETSRVEVQVLNPGMLFCMNDLAGLRPHRHQVMPGETTTFVFHVTNLEGSPTDISLEAAAEGEGWEVRLDVDKLKALAPGETRQAVLTAVAPAGAAAGDMQQVAVTARSASGASDMVEVGAEVTDVRNVYYFSIDSMDPEYLDLNRAGTGPGSEGDWLMPNIRAFLAEGVRYRDARSYLPSATDMDHTNALAGTYTGT